MINGTSNMEGKIFVYSYMYCIFIKLTALSKFDFYTCKYSTLKFEIKKGMLSCEKVNILNISNE